MEFTLSPEIVLERFRILKQSLGLEDARQIQKQAAYINEKEVRKRRSKNGSNRKTIKSN